jgi:hypothetical protein
MPDDAALDVDDGGARLDAPACGWSAVRDAGTVSDPRLTEVSGMVASRRDPGVLFVHNDSGEAVARYFALSTEGVLRAEIVVDGAPSFDIEDAALEHRDGREWIYLGDVGDNAARDGGAPRDRIEVIRAEIPALPSASETLHVGVFERFAFTYPDAPHDCEALVFDHRTGDLYLLSKVNEGPHAVYRAAAPHVDGSARVLEHVVDLLPGRSLADSITAADGDEAGRFVVRTYRRTWLFEASEGDAAARWSVTPIELPPISEFQGEAIAFSADGSSVFSMAEGEGETIHALDDGCAR